MSEQQRGRAALIAPAGFVTLGEAVKRVAERLRWTHAKAEYRVGREIAEGRLRLVERRDLEPLAGPTGEVDFAASEANPPGRPISLKITESPDGGVSSISTWQSSGVPVVLDEDDVDRLLDELAPPAPMYPTQPQAPAAPARPAGRPPEYDWDWVETQSRRRIFRYGLPEKSSILVFEIMALLGRKIANPPEQRTVERKIAKWWPELEALWQEINGPCEIPPPSNDRQNQVRSVAP